MRNFVEIFRRATKWLLGSGLKEDFLVEPPRGFRAYAFTLAGIALAATVVTSQLSITGISSSSAPLMFVVLLGVSVFIGDIVGSQGRDNGVVVTFSGLFVLSAIMVYGPEWQLLAACCVGRLLGLVRSMPLGPAGVSIWTFNLASLVLQSLAAGVVFHAAFGLVPLAIAIAAAGSVDFLVLLVLMTVIGALEGNPRQMASANIENGGLYLVFNIPLLFMGTVAMSTTPYWGCIALFGPVLLGFISTRSGEKLVLTERLLGIDGMTGLRNRNQFWADLHDQVRGSERDGLSLGAIMLDIDNFKILNDTYGHLEGDRALCAVADAITESVRKTDFAARYGGEEFGVLLPDSSVERVMQIAERMRLACKATLEPWGTTVSIGVAAREPGGLAGQPFIGTADAALYRAKHNGKNQVILAGEAELATVDFLELGHDAPDEPAASEGAAA